MKKKYNIAFTPLGKADAFITQAASLASLADTYCLGPASLPHVTLRHFFAEETEIESLWRKACDQLTPHTLTLTFRQLNEYTRDNRLFWLSLLPDHREMLEAMHRTTAQIVGTPVDLQYQAHLTLVNTRMPYQELLEEVTAAFEPVTDEFVLSLGDCDKAGQMTRIFRARLK